LGFDGAITFRPFEPSENEGRQMRCPMLNPWVTEESAIIEMFAMLVASGVPTKNDCP